MRKLQSQGVHHITIVGADRQTSIDFWEGVLGMPFVFEQPNLDRESESHLYFDPGDGRLVVVPNEQVLSAPVFNHSTGDRTAPATVSIWLPPAAPLDEARRVLKPAGAREISVAEITPEGVRLELKGPRDRERTQVGDEESDLRAHAHQALRAAGLLEESGR